ncbi:MAG: beta-L-arabinofuranosidase domain-containing protein, partial [Actinomycetota bacterium]
ELAFCLLSEVTNDRRYKNLAKWMVETRGSRPSPFHAEYDDPVGKDLNKNYEPLVVADGAYSGAYFQDDMPLADQTAAVGHAVRAMYLFCGAADACESQGVQSALTTIWSNLVRKRMYVTGGIGSAGRNEGFTHDFDLPNREAYAETCAAIGLVFWASRMSRLTGDSQYADVMELALYNAAISGVNFDTDRYFYVNPLESRGDHLRQPWFGCACCPPNIARLVMSVQQYAAYKSDDGLTIDLPFSAEYTFETAGPPARVRVESAYPWGGKVVVEVRAGGQFCMRLRVPRWQKGIHSSLNGKHCDTFSHGYIVVDREWKVGDRLELSLAMKPEWLSCDSRVADNVGRMALMNGPLVYCLEEADLGVPVHLFRPDPSVDVTLQSGTDARAKDVLVVTGGLEVVGPQEQLYVPFRSPVVDTTVARFVPYFSWANRTPGSMAVWLRRQEK